MDLLLSMSLVGSMFFLIYLLIRPVILLRFSSLWRYRILKITLLFFLLPYQHLKVKFRGLFRLLSSWILPSGYRDGSGIERVYLSRIIFTYPDGSTYVKNGALLLVLYTIWVVVISAVAFYHLIKYIQCKKILHKISTPPLSLTLYTHHKKAKKREQKVQLLSSPHIAVPFTIGFISPLIVFPATLTEENRRKMALSHELTHISNRDSLIKLLCLAVICLHWYNPFAYLLYYEICITIEHVCDETVTKDMTQEGKADYQMMLLEIRDQETTGKLFVNSFSGNFRVLKERILVMNKTLTSKRIIHLTSFVMAVLLCIFAVFSLITYSPVRRFYIESESELQLLGFDGKIEIYITDNLQETLFMSKPLPDASGDGDEPLLNTPPGGKESVAFWLEEASFITDIKKLTKTAPATLTKTH